MNSVDQLPEIIESPSRYFVSMLIWDAANVEAIDITRLARKLIDSGCAYACFWGDDCERVHDLFDSEWISNGFDPASNDTIMTTWHANDSLDEFIYFSLQHTQPTAKYQPECNTVIAIVIKDSTRSEKIQSIFADTARFYSV
ncbi:MAG: hypothetical protein JNM43_12755 [Planctomycetaceae bacterium]|nr:hypothetical protein [Planctomycetaceae bacterium]